MSLTPLAAVPVSDAQVTDAIASASRNSGVSFHYLLATARRESGLKTTAKSTTSSASGLYQFVQQTWLSTLKSHGADLGLSNYADAITRDEKGRCTVCDPDMKAEILALRQDPTVSAQMAAALAGDNAKSLETQLFRKPTEGELYAAHVLGAHGAARLISGASATPGLAAETLFPEAAAANRGLFYDAKTGEAVSLSTLYARLTGQDTTPAAATTEVAADFSFLRPSATLARYDGQGSGIFGSEALAVLNAIQPKGALIALPESKDEKDKDRAAKAPRVTVAS